MGTCVHLLRQEESAPPGRAVNVELNTRAEPAGADTGAQHVIGELNVSPPGYHRSAIGDGLVKIAAELGKEDVAAALP